MSNVAKLKKQAAEFELKKQFDKALAIYVKLLDTFDENAAELDVALFNRVGDLQLKQGNVADAVDYYERAIDRYADGGFFNNAIALCNKILRHSPGRSSVYYKLGKISAQKGFKSDAKQNFLEYAERMQKAGKIDEAFRALTEFADLCPDQDDIRLMLADQLTRVGRKDEAIEQLQTLYERYESDGRAGEAAATLATPARHRPCDPAPLWRRSRRATTRDELVFLDLGETPRRRSTAIEAPALDQQNGTADANCCPEVRPTVQEHQVEIEQVARRRRRSVGLDRSARLRWSPIVPRPEDRSSGAGWPTAPAGGIPRARVHEPRDRTARVRCERKRA